MIISPNFKDDLGSSASAPDLDSGTVFQRLAVNIDFRLKSIPSEFNFEIPGTRTPKQFSDSHVATS